ncbi:MAG: TIGR00725 family protein [Acidobacteria bacterium]|nr:TIGR00725 family protein [Acidobacteriota bacterium]
MVLDFSLRIAVIGTSTPETETDRLAERVGELIGASGAILFCGGLGGVMTAAARGCRQAGGTTVGVLPGNSEQDANAFVDLPIVTGLGEARNLVLIRSSHAAIAVGGGYGTLSEIGFALRLGIPVVGLRTWDFSQGRSSSGLHCAASAEEAVQKALALARDKREAEMKRASP